MDLVLSLGGSIIIPDKINIQFLKDFRDLIINHAKKGNRIFIITGGGSICRTYLKAAAEFECEDETELDEIGIRATKLNAELVRCMFKDLAYEKVVEDPTKKIETDKKIIIGSGWKPGFSSDYDAVLIAENFSIKTIINLTNVCYVYDKDPKHNDDAKPLKEMSWNELKDLIGEKWTPGLNAPFDPVASKLASVLKLKVIITKGEDLDNLTNLLEEKEFKGTIIS